MKLSALVTTVLTLALSTVALAQSAAPSRPSIGSDVLPEAIAALAGDEPTQDVSPVLVAQTGIANPAAEAERRSRDAAGGAERADEHVPTWKMPPVEVPGHRSIYREEERIGSYAQPRWTAHRRFPATRVYVRPEGDFDLEFWTIAKKPRHGDTEWITQSEAEFGLPYRFQLDLYLITRREGTDGSTFLDQAGEIRWALADWGEIFGNPTLYFEWTMTDSEPDVAETKILFGDELAPSWHWGANFVWEQQTGGSRDREFEFTGALSKTLVDEKLSVGLETKLAWADTKDDRGNFEEDLRVGPSLQWMPLPTVHVDLAPLFGVTSKSRRLELYFVIGIEF